jgi:hypothetical protein
MEKKKKKKFEISNLRFEMVFSVPLWPVVNPLVN